jgi:hypothetical protein
MAGGIALVLASAAAAEPNDCPNGGTVRFGVEPYTQRLAWSPSIKRSES